MTYRIAGHLATSPRWEGARFHPVAERALCTVPGHAVIVQTLFEKDETRYRHMFRSVQGTVEEPFCEYEDEFPNVPTNGQWVTREVRP